MLFYPVQLKTVVKGGFGEGRDGSARNREKGRGCGGKREIEG